MARDLERAAVIVISSDRGPYQAAASACEARLREAGLDTERIDVPDWNDAIAERSHTGVIAIGGAAARQLSENLPTSVPLYYCLTPDPDRLGLTGRDSTSGIAAEVSPQDQLDLISKVAPGAKRLGVLFRSSSHDSIDRLENLRKSLPVGLSIVDIDIDAFDSEANAIRDLLDSNPDFVWTTPDPQVYSAAVVKTLLIEALRRRVPVFGFSNSMVRAGSLVGVGVDPSRQGARCAELFLSNDSGRHLTAEPIIAVNRTVSDRISYEIPSGVLSEAGTVFGNR